MSKRFWEVGQALSWATSILKCRRIVSARLEAEVLLAHSLGCSRARVLAERRQKLSEAQYNSFRTLVEKRGQFYPLQYLTGYQEFMSLDFLVNRQVLIPRQDTEVLVETILGQLPGTPLQVVDVGCGSGAVAVSLAYYRPRWEVWATDLSPRAMELAALNAAKNGVKVQFLQGDLLNPLRAKEGEFQLVVSNPPYIPSSELSTLPPEVGFEPRLALDGGPDGLDVYRSLVPQAQKMLSPQGLLALEIGYDQGDSVKRLLAPDWRDIEIVQDYGGRNRVITAIRP